MADEDYRRQEAESLHSKSPYCDACLSLDEHGEMLRSFTYS